jgi:hypothetical protein
VSAVPSPHEISVRRYAPGQKDEWGDLQETWSPPQPWRVRSIDPASAREPGAANRDLATIAYVIQADKSSEVPDYRDLVVIDGKEYPVDGVTVWVKRTEG